MARQQSIINLSSHPFFFFDTYPKYSSRVYGFVGRTILHGCCVDMDAILLLGYADEIELKSLSLRVMES